MRKFVHIHDPEIFDPAIDTLFMVSEFKDACINSRLTDDNGHGFVVIDDDDEIVDLSVEVSPSLCDKIPASTTHILWYN